MTRVGADNTLRNTLASGSSTRRGALRAFSLSAAAIGASANPSSVLARTSVTPPDEVCTLSRTLTRSLFDGNEIRVSRTWAVRFAQMGAQTGGLIAINGEQASVEVVAPPSLASIAAIEEARSTASMWPIRLTQSGLVLAAGPGIRGEDVDEALQVAKLMIAEKSSSERAEVMIRRFQAELQRAGSSLLDRLPDDLFFPTVGPLRASRIVDLPDGQTGEFEVAYEATPMAGKGWLSRADRQVITRLGGTEQIAREEWSLTEG